MINFSFVGKLEDLCTDLNRLNFDPDAHSSNVWNYGRIYPLRREGTCQCCFSTSKIMMFLLYLHTDVADDDSVFIY